MVDVAVAARPGAMTHALNVTISGKLMEQRRNDGLFYSTILGAAPDEYSAPMPFEVRSRRSLGKQHELVTVPCRIGGFFRRSYDTKPDPNTGEIRRVRPIVMTLDALDADDTFRS